MPSQRLRQSPLHEHARRPRLFANPRTLRAQLNSIPRTMGIDQATIIEPLAWFCTR